MLQVGFGVKNDQHLSWGVYGVYSSNIKIAMKRNKDIFQIQIKYNKTHTVILHRPHAHLFTIHSFVHSFIYSFTSHHSCITHASPTHHTLHHTMHHPFITLHLNASYHASPIRHTASQHIIPVKQYIQQITLTHNALDASQRWCIITIMHHSDDASQQCITTLMHYGTTSL